MLKRSVVFSIVALAWAFPSFALTNSWTKSTNGYWHEPFWSLGVLPSAAQQGVAFTNAGFKALAIGQATVANYPDSLTINNLYVDAPTNSGNLLLLNYAGLNLPLTTDTTHIGRGGWLLSYYSALRANLLAVNGDATFAELAETHVGEASIGNSSFDSISPATNSAVLTLSNGLFSASEIDIATGVPGLFRQYGGTNHTQRLQIGAGGAYALHGGALKVTNTVDLDPSPQGTARLSITGGTAEITELDMITDSPLVLPEFFLSGGTLRATRVVGNYNAQFTQSGGLAELGDIKFPFGGGSSMSSSEYLLSGGVLVSSNLVVGIDGTGYFAFGQSGGIHSNLTTILIHASEGMMTSKTYGLSDGLLVSPRIDVNGGYFTQHRGTNHVGRLSITAGGYYAHAAGEVGEISTNRTGELVLSDGGSYGMVVGAQLWTSNTTVETEGHMNLMLGHHHVEHRLFIHSGGKYTLNSGTLAARYITLEAGGELLLTSGGGTITTNEAVFMRGGTIAVAYGDYQFGSLRVPAGGNVDFPIDGPSGSTSTLRFTDAGYTNGALNAELRILRWTPNVDHLYVGNNPNAITPDQLSLIRFINPEGYPAGSYRARVLSTGEIVPVELSPLTHTRQRDHIVLTWGPGYTLYSSTNVTGPYQQVVPARSPYTNTFTEPQRFFIVRPITSPR